MPAGRPSAYDPAYCAVAVEYLCEGYSVVALAGRLGVAKATIYNWMEVHPEFLAAVKEGQAGAAQWWERQLQRIAAGGPGNVTAAIFGLKNRAPDEWRDKTETRHTGSITIETGVPDRGDD